MKKQVDASSYTTSRDTTRTRADYAKCCDYLRSIDDTPLVQFSRPLVVTVRDRMADKHGRKWANYVCTVLSLLFQWGGERGFIAENPASSIKKLRKGKGEARANRPWTDDERDTVLAGAPPQIRVGLALMLNTGLDPADAMRRRRDEIVDGWIIGVRGKTGEAVAVPVSPALRAALDAAPAHDAITVIASSGGTPWTLSGFQSTWQRFKRNLEASGAIRPGLTLKGCRHTVGTVLREAGCDERTNADLLGQKTEAIARHYSDRADLREKNRKTGTILALAYDERTEPVKPGNQKCQTGKDSK